LWFKNNYFLNNWAYQYEIKKATQNIYLDNFFFCLLFILDKLKNTNTLKIEIGIKIKSNDMNTLKFKYKSIISKQFLNRVSN
tara:strand:- start:345 stop:590 length:246 start_codon:yes stop_codon:yes gene_type:complete